MAMKRFWAGLLALVCLFGMSFADVRAHAEETAFTGTEDMTGTGDTSGTEETTEPSETETPENPMISATKLTLELGTQSRLRVNGVMGKFKWKSSNPEVVKVTKYGKLLARAVGKATVSVTVNGKTLKCKVTVKEAQYVSIIAVGDNLYHDYMIYKKGSSSNGMVDYDNIYSGIKDYIADVDVKIINQETILTTDKSKWKGYPQFGTPTEVGDAVVRAGFNVITAATNHSNDNGTSGILGAVKYWKAQAENGVLMTGIYDSQADYDTIRVGEYNGVKIAFLNYTYGTNGLALESGKSYLVKLLKESLIEKEIKAAKKIADVVIVLPHWGEEYHYRPVSSQKSLAQKMANWGADIIIGAHPHVLEPMVTITASDGREVPCYYSLGNFCGNMAITHNTNCTLEGMAELTVKVFDGKVTIESAELTPLVNHINNTDTQFKVYRLEDYTDAIAKGHLANNHAAGTITPDKLWKLYKEICDGTAKSSYD
ncbi:MAG: CapA family protein [Lachnospiraceae bacterium]|nr:CapA family protein [Lachnospiraceae bacterium]